MQPENPCNLHETKQVNFVCLSKDCTLQRLFCETCKGNHYTHHVVSYNQFEKIYDKFQEVVEKGGTKITKQFLRVKETFALCIKRTQEKVLKQIMSCYPLPKLQQLQFQQRFGIINQIVQNQNFSKSIDNSLQLEIKNQDKYISDLSIYLEELNTSVMASINKFMSQLKVAIDTHANMIKKANLLASMVDMPVQYFKFSQQYKPQNYVLSENRACVTRTSLAGEGLSMYCIIEQPLSKQNNTIIFTITEQKQRFIYFGVCDREVFKLHNFKGNLYEKGRKMYSIRQSAKEGANAVCLHNSKDEYSNKDQVPWDFKMGDIITLKYIEQKNVLQYIKNGSNIFEMPLDKETNKFYPFVGLKHQSDSVKILSAKKKGFFSSLF